MCTLILALGQDATFPVVLAANRDERLNRPASGWQWWHPANAPPFLAPVDLVAGGSWVGINQHGVVAALTNHHTGHPPDPERRSRGDLIPWALSFGSAAGALAVLAGMDAARFNPFHLAVADGKSAWLWHTNGVHASLEPLGPGLHIITESTAHGDDPRGHHLRSVWPGTGSLTALQQLLAQHGPDTRAATCIHMGELYGTRSSAVLQVARPGGVSHLATTSGAPCTSPWEDQSALLGSVISSP